MESDAPEVGKMVRRDGAGNDTADADEQEHDWMDTEWYVGHNVQKVNEMWERDRRGAR